MIRLCAVLLWLAIESAARLMFRPLRRWLTRRAMRSWHEEHGGPPDEILEDFHSTDEVRSMAVNTGLRSSSNMVIAGGLTNIVVEVLQMVWPEFVLSPEMRTYLTLGIAWLASRFTKTPAQPGAV